uniref:Uncharacterized protein n=1 Tax=Oryza meridionalis TaxID=40149 RepID=A0A0E0FCB0_9ORYZ
MDEAVWLDERTDAAVLDLSFAAPGGDGDGRNEVAASVTRWWRRRLVHPRSWWLRYRGGHGVVGSGNVAAAAAALVAAAAGARRRER